MAITMATKKYCFVCPECKHPYTLDKETFMKFDVDASMNPDKFTCIYCHSDFKVGVL